LRPRERFSGKHCDLPSHFRSEPGCGGFIRPNAGFQDCSYEGFYVLEQASFELHVRPTVSSREIGSAGNVSVESPLQFQGYGLAARINAQDENAWAGLPAAAERGMAALTAVDPAADPDRA
jgi:hypothetical protein